MENFIRQMGKDTPVLKGQINREEHRRLFFAPQLGKKVFPKIGEDKDQNPASQKERQHCLDKE